MSADKPFYGGVALTTDDVQRLRPEMTVEEATAFLLKYEESIHVQLEGVAMAILRTLLADVGL